MWAVRDCGAGPEASFKWRLSAWASKCEDRSSKAHPHLALKGIACAYCERNPPVELKMILKLNNFAIIQFARLIRF